MARGALILNQHDYGKDISTVAKGLIGSPLDEARAELMGAQYGKARSDMETALQEREAKNRVSAALADPNFDMSKLPSLLVGAGSGYLGQAANLNLLRIMSDPNMTPQQKADAIQAAGHPYSSSQQGFYESEKAQTARTLGAASIAAGPGYANVAQRKYEFANHPIWVTDPDGTNPRMVFQKDIGTVSGVQPFEPTIATTLLKPQEYSPTPGGPNQYMPLSDMNKALQGGAQIYAPTPPGVQVEQAKPIAAVPATAPPGTQPTYVTQGKAGSGDYRPPTATALQEPIAAVPKEGGPPVFVTKETATTDRMLRPPPDVAPPQPQDINANVAFDMDQMAQQVIADRAGLGTNYFTGTGKDATGARPDLLPKEYTDNKQKILVRAGELYQQSRDMVRSVQQAMDEQFGQGWQFQMGGNMISRIFTPSAMQPGQTYTGPQVTRDPGGARVIPPAAPKVQSAPTISIRGNPAPPQPVAKRDEGGVAATRLQQARDAIAANPAARDEVIRRLRAMGIDASGL